MYETFRTSDKALNNGCIDVSVPRFHEEFREAGTAWPRECGRQACFAQLAEGFANASMLPAKEIEILRRAKASKLTRCDDSLQQEIFRRLAVSKNEYTERLQWLVHAPMGDINPIQKPTGPYAKSLCHSFSNAQNSMLTLERGKLYVAVGFVDLSPLRGAQFVGDMRRDAPTCFVGYESSPYSVAKTLVIAQMLRKEDPQTPRDVLLVWYSSTWSRRALRAFTVALNEVAQLPHAPAVSELLTHWQRAVKVEVPLTKARAGWLAKQSEMLSLPGKLLRLKDRLAMCAYIISGDVLPHEAEVGSVCMWEFPPGWPAALPKDECMLGTLPLYSLLDRCLPNSSDCSIVEGGAALLQEHIGELHRAVSGRTMLIELHLAEVSLEHPELLAGIAGRNPWLVFWNNVGDYSRTCAEFHRLARSCSGLDDTMHHAYSMNWVFSVKGTFLSDKEMELSFEEIKNIISLFKQAEAQSYTAHNALMGQLIKPCVHVRHTADSCLQLLHAEAWTKHFFDAAEFDSAADPKRHRAPACGPAYIQPSIFTHSTQILPLHWTYDPLISFDKS